MSIRLNRRWIAWAATGAVSALLLAYGATRAWLAYESDRTAQMFADLQALQIGAPASSIQPFVKKYESPDFRYNDEKVVLIDPLHGRTPFVRWKWLDGAIRNILFDRFSGVRRKAGLRVWEAFGQVKIDRGEVSAISGDIVVEGKDEWLGANWTRVGDLPHWYENHRGHQWKPEMGQYLAGWMHLHMGDETGEVIWNTLGPEATKEETQVSQSINFGCLTSIGGCPSLCSLMPAAVQYHHQRGEYILGWNSGSWGQQDQSCH